MPTPWEKYSESSPQETAPWQKYGGNPPDQAAQKNWKEKLRDFTIPLPSGPSSVSDMAAMAVGGPVGYGLKKYLGGETTNVPMGTSQVKPALTGVGSALGSAGGPIGSFAGGFTGSQAGRLLQEISPELFGQADSPLSGGLKDAALNEVINTAFKGVKFTPERLKLIKQQLTTSLERAEAPEATAGSFIPGKISQSPEQVILHRAGQSLKTDIAGGEFPNSIEEQGKSAFSKVHEHVKDLEEGFNAQQERLSKISPATEGKSVEYDPADELPPDIRRGYKKALSVDKGGEGTPSQFFDTAIKTPEGTRRLVDYVGRDETANHFMTRFLDNHGTISGEGEQFFDAIKARKTFEEQLPIIKEFTNSDQRSQIKYFLDHAASIDPRLTKEMALNTTGDGLKMQIPAALAKMLFPRLSMLSNAVKIGLQITDSDIGKALLNPSFARAAASAIKTPYQKAAAQDSMRILLGTLKGTTVGILRNDEPVTDMKLN